LDFDGVKVAVEDEALVVKNIRQHLDWRK